MNKRFARIAAVSATSVALVLASGASAFAALPASVTAAMADMQTDSTTVGVGFLVAVLSIAAFKMLRRAG